MRLGLSSGMLSIGRTGVGKRIAKDSKHFHAYARPVTDGSYSRDTHPTYGNSMYGTKWVGTEDDVRKYLSENDPKLLKRNSLLRWVPGKVTSFSPAYKTWSVELLGRDRHVEAYHLTESPLYHRTSLRRSSRLLVRDC